MMKLLNIELKKLLPYKAFKILLLTFLISLAATILIGEQLNDVSEMIPGQQVNTLGFPYVWNFYLYAAFLVNIILSLLVIFIVCNEYTYRTIRQNIIDGLTRNELVVSKIILIVLLSLMSTVVVYITGILAGMHYSASWEFSDIFHRNALVFGYFLQILCLHSLAYLFGTIFKRSGIATIAFILFLFPIDLIINQAIFNGEIRDYMPVSNMFRKITEWPFIYIINGDVPPQASPSIMSVCVATFYIIFFFGAGWFITKKRDL